MDPVKKKKKKKMVHAHVLRVSTLVSNTIATFLYALVNFTFFEFQKGDQGDSFLAPSFPRCLSLVPEET